MTQCILSFSYNIYMRHFFSPALYLKAATSGIDLINLLCVLLGYHIAVVGRRAVMCYRRQTDRREMFRASPISKTLFISLSFKSTGQVWSQLGMNASQVGSIFMCDSLS